MILLINTIGCITVPVDDLTNHNECLISSDRKTLKVINLNFENTGYYYSLSGAILSPILVPTTAIISGTYVFVNNIYHLGETKVKCSKKIN
ncbi:MAG: hypothetical protein COA74_13050 [Gammaproteobacteria bacterium]|nr:MAG: hypothetical protein COA74_13050 [Gammaproteobacteria bacterium]